MQTAIQKLMHAYPKMEAFNVWRMEQKDDIDFNEATVFFSNSVNNSHVITIIDIK